MSCLTVVAEETGYDRPVPIAWKQLAALRVQDPASRLQDLARAVGYSYQTVLIWIKRMDYQRYESWLADKEKPLLALSVETDRAGALQRVRERFEAYTEEMQDRLLSIIETTPDPKFQAELCQDWLDRAGAGVPKANTNRSLAVVMTPEVMERFLTRTKEAGLDPVDPIEAEVLGSSPT